MILRWSHHDLCTCILTHSQDFLEMRSRSWNAHILITVWPQRMCLTRLTEYVYDKMLIFAWSCQVVVNLYGSMSSQVRSCQTGMRKMNVMWIIWATVWSSSFFSIHWRKCKFPTPILLEHTPKLVKMTTFTLSHKPTWASCFADDIKIDWLMDWLS